MGWEMGWGMAALMRMEVRVTRLGMVMERVMGRE
jgi:hypothetical protein